MASVPTIDFRADDVMDGGKLSAQKVADALTRISRLYREAMSHGVTPDNLREQEVELVFTTRPTVASTFPIGPIPLADYMPPAPAEVRLAYIENLTAPSAAWISGVAVNWKPAGDRSFIITYVSGLSSSTKYRVRLRVA